MTDPPKVDVLHGIEINVSDVTVKYLVADPRAYYVTVMGITEQRMRLEQAEILSCSNIQAVMSWQSMKIRAERPLGLAFRLRVARDSWLSLLLEG